MLDSLRQHPLLRDGVGYQTILRTRVGIATVGTLVHAYASWIWGVNLWLLGVSVLQLLVATMVVSERARSFAAFALAADVAAAVTIGVVAGDALATVPWLVALLPLQLVVLAPWQALAFAASTPLAVGVAWILIGAFGQVPILQPDQLAAYLAASASAVAVAVGVIAVEIGMSLHNRAATEQARIRQMAVITDHSPVGMAIQDEDRTFVYSNPRLRELMDLTEAQISHTGFADAVPPEVMARVEPIVTEAQMKGEAVSFNHPIRRSDGTMGWVDVSMSAPLVQADGRAGYVFTVFDVTEKMAATIRSRRFADALDGTSDVVLLWDSLRRPLHMNAAFLQFFGASEENRAAAVEQIFGVLADKMPRWSQLPGGSTVEFEAEFLRRNASQPTPFSVVATVGHDDAQGRSFALIGRDISALRRVSEELREVVRAKDEFVASVSHELRTPLAVVLGLAHELSESPDRFDRQELAELTGLIAEQSNDVAAIVEDLLMIARAHAGALAVTVEPVDLLAVTNEAFRSAPAHQATDIAVAPGLGALADAGRLRQVLRNLIVNAQRHGGPDIRVFGRAGKDFVELVIADSGPEIRGAVQATMFDAYERGNRQSKGPDSVGLGLTVSRTLARLMGGEVEYRYQDGWSQFVVRLPAADVGEPPPGIVVDDRDAAHHPSQMPRPSDADSP